ncbi:MAG: 50S ribosomal protein L29 [Candidatus Kerfeldbacteria bacterium]|nr:50S ribosomal protein L29 [Candidatus Kerfeldbacteria bacterium]
MMTLKELREQSEKDLQKALYEQRRKLQDFHFKMTSQKVGNIRELRGSKRTIAQILTVLREKKNIKTELHS